MRIRGHDDWLRCAAFSPDSLKDRASASPMSKTPHGGYRVVPLPFAHRFAYVLAWKLADEKRA